MLKVLKPTSSFINCHKCSTSNSPPNAAISVQCVPRNIQKCFLPTELASTSLLLERWSNQFLKMRLESELAIPATLLILKIWVSQNPKVTQQKWLIFVGIWGWTSIYCIYGVSERFHARVLKHPSYTMFYEKKTSCNQPWHSVNHDPVISVTPLPFAWASIGNAAEPLSGQDFLPATVPTHVKSEAKSHDVAGWSRTSTRSHIHDFFIQLIYIAQ